MANDAVADNGPGAAWRLRFWTVFVGQRCSLIGGALAQFVLSWWIAGDSGSTGALAAMSVMAMLPAALLGPLGGLLADRYNRRLIMISAGLMRALCMVVLMALFFAQLAELWHVGLLLLIRGLMSVLQQSAASASVSMLVPRRFLARAAGLDQVIAGVSMIGAAPLGALMLSFMPLGYILGVDLLVTLVGIISVLVYRVPQEPAPSTVGTHPWGLLREGLQVIWSDRGLRHLHLLLAAVSICTVPAFTLMLLLVKEHFAGSAIQVAQFSSANSLGMIAGGLLVGVLSPRKRVGWVLGGFAASCLMMGLTALLPRELFWLAIGCWLLCGVAFALSDALFVTLLQLRVSSTLQGRVLSIFNTLLGLAGPIGLAFATILDGVIGVRWVFVAMGLTGTLIVLLGLHSKAISSLES
ncbi:MFS transporter [Pseudomonas sp. dw_612]|uniref:MFS transporter n=1 Tax=Pseudomonas sp. dw_612 TaxID=2720080 RepID=UPI001BD51D84|nr:MFS transporter [Pseudomonas sp. dw_612]